MPALGFRMAAPALRRFWMMLAHYHAQVWNASELGLPDARALETHPKVGASWEGFALEAVIAALGARPEECFFWATYSGAELDLLVVRGRRHQGHRFRAAAGGPGDPKP